MTRFRLVAGVTLVLMGTATGLNAAQDKPAALTTPANLSGLHDFDFLVGEWRIHSRRLKERLTGSHEWEEFEGTLTSRRYMDGWANVDDTVFHMPQGIYR